MINIIEYSFSVFYLPIITELNISRVKHCTVEVVIIKRRI